MARAGILVLLVAALLGQAAWACRMDPTVQASYCGLPYDASNFQGYFECDNSVKLGRPKNLKELQAMVPMFQKAKAVGMGASFNKEFFCAGNTSQAINIVMTEMQDTLSFIQGNPKPADYCNKTIPPNFPIQVDETVQTVTVAAGVPQRMLLDWLADYRYWKQPSGWILPAQSWFIDQTIGGAISTNTHGSSMQYGSLSSQVVSLKVVLGDGSLLEVNPKTNPHLWRAFGVSVGRLGIVYELTLKIKPQMAVQKEVRTMPFAQWVSEIKAVQDAYKDAKNDSDVVNMKRALSAVDEMQTFWFVPTQQMWRIDFEYLNKEPLAVLLNIDTQQQPLVKAMSGPADDVFDQVQQPSTPKRPQLANNARYWSNFYASAARQYAVPGVYEASKAYLSMTEQGTGLMTNFAAYDQYEVSIPIEFAADCMAEVGAEIYGKAALWNGFRTPALIRFVPGEEFYLSNTHGGPRMYINLEDYISRQTGKKNVEFTQVINLFRQRCKARLHWGKAGWVERGPECFDGAKEYPDTWCHFGCAVGQLDPTNKFTGTPLPGTLSDVWHWNATRDGKVVNFASCCSSTGFSDQCQCARRDCKQ